jgi:hypothetical protein
LSTPARHCSLLILAAIPQEQADYLYFTEKEIKAQDI